MSTSFSLLELPATERPRERMVALGAQALSTVELLAIIMGSGSRTHSVIKIAEEILSRFESIKDLAEATIEELCQVPGVGLTKAVQIKAATALGMRLSNQMIPNQFTIKSPADAYSLVKEELSKETREVITVILLNTKGGVINQQIVSIGTLNQALIHPREVFHPAVRHKAASIILVHNHPSGDPTPSKEDISVTKTMLEVGRTLEIPLQDHIIVGRLGFVSLREAGHLSF